MPHTAPPLDRSPLEEIAKRVAEGAVGLSVAARAVGLEDHRRMLRDHARRLEDSHRIGMKTLGFGEESSAKTEGDVMDDDMGNIIVTGDINISDGSRKTTLPWEKPSTQPSPPATIASVDLSPPAPPTTAATPPKPGLSNLATGAIAAGLLASGLGGGAVTTYLLTRPETTVVIPDRPDRPDKNWGLNLLPPDQRKAIP